MNIKKIFTKKRLLFIGVFLALVLIGKQINFSPVLGAENQQFTLFQFFGPVAGSFLGPVFGALTVLGALITDFLFKGSEFNLINLIRLTPMLFAAYYFGTHKKKLTVALPLIAMALFMLHPVGGQVWFYSLYWLIPATIKMLPKKYSNQLFLKSLGATFTAHAVGTIAWLYSVPMTAGQWASLIPVVAYERLLFAMGITGSYIVLNLVLVKVVDKFNIELPQGVLFLKRKPAIE